MMAAYAIGDHVGFVELRDGRMSVPLPQRWFIKQAVRGRDAKVIELCAQLDISAYSPTLVRYVDRNTGADAVKPHLGRKVVAPLLPGLLFIPDFDAHLVDGLGRDYVQDWLQLGPRLATLSAEEMHKLREIEAAFNSRRSGRGKRGKVTIGTKGHVSAEAGPLANFAAVVEQGVDSRGRLKVFIASLMGGASVSLDEALFDPG